MGVPGLWRELYPEGGTEDDLLNITLRALGNGTCFVMGIDISQWLYQMGYVHQPNHARRGKNPELRTIFYRLVNLVKLPFAAIFVFDGPGRPSEKRGKVVQASKPHWLEPDVWRLVEAFGFHCHRAPGEAEAELARLNCKGIVDAVLTDDIDAMVFGASTVLSKAAFNTESCNITVYQESEACLSTADMLLFALVSGGDYTSGLFGAGPRLAFALSNYDIGERLFAAACTLPPNELQPFLTTWRASFLAVLKNDPLKALPSSCSTAEHAVPESFPDINTVLQYAAPLTSWSNGGQPSFKRSSISLRQPDLAALARICADNFSWATCEGVLKVFRKTLWRNCLVRGLCCNIVASIASSETSVLDPSRTLKILHTDSRLSCPAYQVSCSAVKYYLATTAPFKDQKHHSVSTGHRKHAATQVSEPSKSTARLFKELKATVPATILASTHSAELAHYNSNMTVSKKPTSRFDTSSLPLQLSPSHACDLPQARSASPQITTTHADVAQCSTVAASSSDIIDLTLDSDDDNSL